jgi:hypothetical protein
VRDVGAEGHMFSGVFDAEECQPVENRQKFSIGRLIVRCAKSCREVRERQQSCEGANEAT